MKRLILIGVIVAVLIGFPMTVAADDCCDYPVGSCCWRRCCEEVTYWWKVSYFEDVWLWFPEWGIGYWAHEWVSEYVEARDRNAAARQLGFKSVRGCSISHVGYRGQ